MCWRKSITVTYILQDSQSVSLGCPILRRPHGHKHSQSMASAKWMDLNALKLKPYKNSVGFFAPSGGEFNQLRADLHELSCPSMGLHSGNTLYSSPSGYPIGNGTEKCPTSTSTIPGEVRPGHISPFSGHFQFKLL